MFACLKPCFNIVAACWAGHFAKRLLETLFECSSILPCNHAFVQHFQGTLYLACSVLKELVIA